MGRLAHSISISGLMLNVQEDRLKAGYLCCLRIHVTGKGKILPAARGTKFTAACQSLVALKREASWFACSKKDPVNSFGTFFQVGQRRWPAYQFRHLFAVAPAFCDMSISR